MTILGGDGGPLPPPPPSLSPPPPFSSSSSPYMLLIYILPDEKWAFGPWKYLLQTAIKHGCCWLRRNSFNPTLLIETTLFQIFAIIYYFWAVDCHIYCLFLKLISWWTTWNNRDLTNEKNVNFLLKSRDSLGIEKSTKYFKAALLFFQIYCKIMSRHFVIFKISSNFQILCV